MGTPRRTGASRSSLSPISDRTSNSSVATRPGSRSRGPPMRSISSSSGIQTRPDGGSTMDGSWWSQTSKSPPPWLIGAKPTRSSSSSAPSCSSNSEMYSRARSSPEPLVRGSVRPFLASMSATFPSRSSSGVTSTSCGTSALGAFGDVERACRTRSNVSRPSLSTEKSDRSRLPSVSSVVAPAPISIRVIS